MMFTVRCLQDTPAGLYPRRSHRRHRCNDRDSAVTIALKALSSHMPKRALMNGDRRVPETLEFQDPPGRIRRLEDVNTLWAEILSEPSTAIADLINTVDR